MLYSLRGKLIYKEPNFAVVECAGVGYKCFTTINTQRELPEIGQEVMLFTYMNVREDSVELFGFKDQSELSCFKMLTSVSGVGAKMGISILSCLSHQQVAMAIVSSDSKTLTKAQGVGNKLAQRIILELKDKLKNTVSADSSVNNQIYGSSAFMGNATEAINALSVLGYVPAEVAPVVARFDSSLPVEELIRLSLKAMSGGK